MTRKNRARYGLSRTYKVSATAKALRGAMIAALATAGASQSALAADECIVLGQNIQCVGATNDVIDNSELEYPNSPFDLTTVTFATNFNSVVLNWHGVDISVGGNDDLRINNLGSIFIVDDNEDSGDIGNTLYGVRADAIDGGISFNNSDSGTVLVDIDQNNEWWDGDSWNWEWNGAAVGVDLYGEDFATVTNAGLISAGNSTWDNNGWSDATALRVDAEGDVSVVNQAFGSIYAYSLEGDAFAVDLWSDYGDIAVVNNANIAASGNDWTVGVFAETDADISVTNAAGAEIRAYSEWGSAQGVNAHAWYNGDISVDNAGLVHVRADDWGTGVYAETVGGNVSIGNTGLIDVSANDAAGIAVETAYGNVDITNDNDITVWGYAQAAGVSVANIFGTGDVNVANAGHIHVNQEGDFNNGSNGPFDILGDATGIAVFNGIAAFYGGPNPGMGYGDVTVTNSNHIDVWADGGDAAGIGALSFGGDVTISNNSYGEINVFSGRNDAVGIVAATIFADVTIANTGLIEVYADGWNGYGDAVGVGGSAKYGVVDIDNSGRIFVDSNNGDATGIRAYAVDYGVNGPSNEFVGDIHVGNTGLVDVFGDENATGIYTVSENGATVIDNTGTIITDADEYSSTGIRAVSRGDSYGDITVNNTGVRDENNNLVGGIIDVYTHSWGEGDNDAVGIDVRSESYGDITVSNSGRIGVYSEVNNSGDAWGVRVQAGNYYNGSNYSGSITVDNSGLIDVFADDDAWGIRADSAGTGGDITVTNSGDIDVSVDDADAYGIDLATGNYAYADITVTNSGNIRVDADENATGIDGSSNGYGDLIVGNSGLIDVNSDWDDAYGMELSVSADFGDYELTVTNSGRILVGSYEGHTYGVKAENDSDDDLTITNVGIYNEVGDITGGIITSYSREDSADGVHAYHYGSGDIVIGNSGLIRAETYSDYSTAIGVDMHHYGSGDIRLTNSGTIVGESSYGEAWGIHASHEGEGVINIGNSGDIFAQGDNSNTIGIMADGYGDITVGNTGLIQAIGQYDTYGVKIDSYFNGSVSVTNAADADVYVRSFNGDAYGIDVEVFMDGDLNSGASVNISNAGDINVASDNDWATGVRVAVREGSNYYPTQGFICGNIAGCTGLDGYSVYNDWVVTEWSHTEDGQGSAPVTISNSGNIDVVSWNSYAEGIMVRMGNGSYGELASVTNTGSIQVYAQDYDAVGIKTINDYGDTVINNTGLFEDDGEYLAGGLIVVDSNYWSAGIEAHSDSGDITIVNSGVIDTFSANDNSNGIWATTETGDISFTNSASATIYVDANGTDGYAWGVEASSSNGGDVSIGNAGDVVAFADYANALYSRTYNGGDITVSNSGGAYAIGEGRASAIDLYSDDGDITVTNSGVVSASSSAYEGYAFGVYAESEYGDISVTNSAGIVANANGDYGDAVGIWAIAGSGDITVNNSGNVFANANGDEYGWSVGIYTDNGDGATTVTNSGNVRATSDGVNQAWAIYHSGDSVAITNAAAGNIFGTIETDNAADSFTNNGDWYATEGDSYVSEFNGGNDSIVNNTGARIFMNDSVIDLGYAEGGVNSFLNNGKVFVRGTENVIDMGGATSVFTNNGASLHFEDGAANDVLTVYGDFAGNGHIVVDANGTSMLADRLYIDGDVISNTANVIDVYLSNNPTLAQITDGVEIDIVQVSGTSTAANFNLGIVDVDAADTLYTVSHTLNKHINVSGSNDLFALGFEISGLTQSGVAVSSIAPAVQNLWHLGAGTMFQRQGSTANGGGASGSPVKGFLNAADGGQVADYQGASGAWVRMFADNGGLTPEMGRSNFGTGGVQQFDLNSSGIEFGAGYAFNEQWTGGLLGGVSEASLKPQVGGRTKVDADTLGAYLTYTPGNGFYADFSYRAMGFDGQGNGDGFRFKGDADGFGIELGYGFKTDAGLVIEPQFQYTSMDVNLDQVDYFDGDFELTDGKSSQMRGSIALRKTYQSGAGEWTPYASLGVVNETNASNDYVIGGLLTGNVDTSGNSTLVEAGATAHYGNMVFSGGVNWKDGGAYDSLFGGQVSVRFTW